MNRTGAEDQAPTSSPWAKIQEVFRQAEILKSLYELKREDPDSTQESAMAWAREKLAEAER